MSAMALHNPSVERTPRRWRNELPTWVVADAAFGSLRSGPRATLQAIADKADAPDRSGHLLNAFGGKGMVAACGCCRKTFFSHVKELERLGFVVCTARGYRMGGKDIGNVYAVPGARGGLEGRKVSRRMQRMVHLGSGVYRPQVFDRSGETPGLFEGVEERSAGQPGLAPVNPAAEAGAGQPGLAPVIPDPSEAPGVTRGVVQFLHGGACKDYTGGSVKLTLHHSPHHPPTHSPSHRARGGGGGAEPASGRGAEPSVFKSQVSSRKPQASDLDELNRRLATLCHWLDLIGWRAKASPRQRAAMIRRDPSHAFRCQDEFRERAAGIVAAGRKVKSPAALFDSVFTGAVDAGGGEPRPGPLEQLRAMRRRGGGR